MRLRNVKNKEEIINKTSFLILNPNENMGNWKNVFNNSNPIEIEIGMGKGDFIIEKAITNPNINYIGIEKYDSVIVRAIEKVKEPLDNLKLIRMDASVINTVFHKEISKIYLNFSDPWPKNRHNIRRLTSKIYLEKYENIFRGDKIIIQKTDNIDLFEYSIVSYSNFGYIIDDISLDLHSREDFDNIMTEYERKFSKKGKNIYYISVKK